MEKEPCEVVSSYWIVPTCITSLTKNKILLTPEKSHFCHETSQFAVLCFLRRRAISMNLLKDANDAKSLRLSPESELYRNKLWMDRHFPQNSSSESPLTNGFLQTVIISGENVLSPDSLRKISILHDRIVNHLPDYSRFLTPVLPKNNFAF